MRKLLHAADVIVLLQQRVKRHGNRMNAALALQIDPAAVSRALNSEDPSEHLTPKLLDALKLESVPMYAEKGTYRRIK